MQNKLFREAALDRLSSTDQLDQSIQVMRSQGWLALGALGAFLIAVIVWALLGTIPTVQDTQGILVKSDSAQGAPLQVVIFMPIRLASRISPGMQTQVIPLTLSSDLYGVVSGHVESVSPVPATADRLTQVLTTPALQQSLAPNGLAVEIHVALDSDGVAGYHWSKTAPPAEAVQAGIPVSVRLVITDQHPINLIFP